MAEPTPADVAWCRGLYDALAEGGVWGVPRSGLVFRKQDGALILYERMPHDPAMPLSPAGLRGQQDADYFLIKRYFRHAGIAVRDDS